MTFIVAIPSFNEAECLRATVNSICTFFDTHYPTDKYIVVVSDNGSTDGTKKIGKALEKEKSAVKYIDVKARGKGRAIRTGWKNETADAYLFTDADLAYGTDALASIVASLKNGNDVAVVSRMLNDSSKHQSTVRHMVTQGYNALLHLLFKHSFSDAQAGCKGISKKAYDALIPYIKEDGWFFDTELLLQAEARGFQIHEIPTTNIDPRPRPPDIAVIAHLLRKTLIFRFKNTTKRAVYEETTL